MEKDARLWYNVSIILYHSEKNIMPFILVASMVLFYTFQSAFCNQYARHYPGEKKNASFVYSVLYGVIVALVTLILAKGRFAPSGITVLLGCINGAVLILYNTMLIKASTSGPYSITIIFKQCGGILFPLIVSVFAGGEVLSVWQFTAIGVMLLSFVIINLGDKKSDEKITPGFIVKCLILSAANGCYAILLNSQKKLTAAGEDREMIIITFGVSAFLALILLAVQNGRSIGTAFRQNKKSVGSFLCASVSAASAVNILMYTLNHINVVVLQSLNNGAILIVSVLWAMIILRERIGRNKLVGLILAVSAVVALSIL